jgi:FixJ family two-component response regulator
VIESVQQTVFIVDDDPAIRDGLCNLLESVGLRSDLFTSAEDFLLRWKPERPGCMMLDVRLPGITGVELQERMQQSGIAVPIIFMTAHGDIPMVRKVMKAGAVEFLTKPFQKEEMLHAVEQAFAWDRARRLEGAAIQSIQSRLDTLTAREREVMAMITAGMLNKQIAADLNLSEITVKLHRRHVMEKMRADSLADLVKMSERVRTHSLAAWPITPLPAPTDSQS